MRIPTEIQEYFNVNLKTSPTTENSPLNRTDIVVIEPNTNMEIELDGYTINRFPIQRLVYSIRDVDYEIYKLARRWFEYNINDVRADLAIPIAKNIIEALPSDFYKREIAELVFLSAKSRRADVENSLLRLTNMLDLPVGVVAYTWSYMADGRAISWPAEFYSEIVASTKKLGLPLFDPREFIERVGVKFAMKEDFQHYSDDFMDCIGQEIAEFALSIKKN